MAVFVKEGQFRKSYLIFYVSDYVMNIWRNTSETWSWGR